MDISLRMDSQNSNMSVADFYAKKSVFVTGGTGFLGKVYIERILATCCDVDKVYVLIREKKGVSPEERLRNITDDPLFTKLKELRPRALDKIVLITGDMTEPNLGIKTEDQYLLKEKVSVVYHCAADTRFMRPLKYLVRVNVEGTRQLLQLCHKMNNLQAFIYVSTAYCNSEKSIVDEIVHRPPRELDDVYKTVDHLDDPDKEKIFIKDKPNNYAFTKALAESLVLEEHGDIPSIIIRPTSVCCIKGEPLPGWLDNWHGPTGLVYDLATGKTKYFHGKKDNVIDIIPADYVTNLAIAAATRCGGESKDVKVYNSSSTENPLTYGHLVQRSRQEYRKICKDCVDSKIFYINTDWLILLLSLITEFIPAYVKDCWLRCADGQPRHVKRLRTALIRREVYGPFTKTSFVWNTKNARELYASLTERDQQIYPFDPTDIEWDKYISDYCTGVCRHLSKK